MSDSKRKPPPDDVGNLHGRLLAVRNAAHQSAMADVKAGADPARALSKRRAEVESVLKGLRRRLALVLKQPAAKGSEKIEDFLDSLKSA